MELVKPSDLPALVSTASADYLVVDNGSVVGKATAEQVVNAGSPVPTQAEAIAGTNNTKRMTPLTTRQVLDNEILPSVLRAQAWAESPDPPDPLLPDSRSSKTWATAADAAAGLSLGAADVAIANAIFKPPAQSGALTRPMVNRARDSVSALDLMTAGGLDEAVRHREATADDAATIYADVQEVLEDCSAHSWAMDVPAGTYHLDTRLTASKPVSIMGAGNGRSVLNWGDAPTSAGIKISAGDSFAQSSVSDLTLLVGGSSPSHTAIEFDYSSLVVGGTIVPRAQLHARVNSVRIASTTGSAGIGWNRGIDGVNLIGLNVSNCRITGVIEGGTNGNLPLSDYGICLRGNGKPVELNISQSYVSGMYDAVYTEDAEGVYINGSEFVNVGWGWRTNNAALESGFALSNGHINSLIGGIHLQKMADGIVSGMTFYHNELSVSDEIRHVVLDTGTLDIVIANNVFKRLTSDIDVVSIDLVGGSRAIIGPNHHSFGTSAAGNLALRIASGAASTSVSRQTYNQINTAEPMINNSTTAQFEMFRGYAGDLNAIYTDWRIAYQVHQLASGASNGPSGVAVSSSILETLSMDTNTATQRLHGAASSGKIYARRKLSGAWGNWYAYTGAVV